MSHIGLIRHMKFKELTTKSEGEVNQLLTDLRAQAHDLAVKIRLNEVKNNHKLSKVKKDIARVLTFLHTKKND